METTVIVLCVVVFVLMGLILTLFIAAINSYNRHEEMEVRFDVQTEKHDRELFDLKLAINNLNSDFGKLP